jgi:lysozyme
MTIIPPNRPQAPREKVLSAMRKFHRDQGKEIAPVTVVVAPGYFSKTFGEPGNDRGVYDDAAFVITDRTFTSFNFNSDPSRHKTGLSTVLPGIYPYRRGIHKRGKPGAHSAYRPATPGEALPVKRDGEKGRSKRDGVANNNHRGGWNAVNSDGCLTVPPHNRQWDAYYALVDSEMSRLGVVNFNMCILPEGWL